MPTLEKAEEELSTQTASTAFQLAWGAISKLGKKAWDKATLARVMKRYAEKYLVRHGQVKILGMSRPIPLSTIYTAVQVVSPNRSYSYNRIDAFRESLSAKKRDPYQETKAVPGITAANKERFLNILGAPGAGKSTFLKRVGLESLMPRGDIISEGVQEQQMDSGGQYIPECFPVYIELRRFRNEAVDIFQALVNEFDSCGLPDSAEFVTLCLKEGKLLLLFDGVDEVPTEKLEAAIQSISDFADKYDQNRFITSCRTAFYKTFFQKFVDVELAAFNDKQIKTFADNWFSSETDKEIKASNNFVSLLFSAEHRSTLELARTPLLLTFLCLVYDDSQKLPSNRSSLYRRSLMILMEKWAAEKRVHNSPVYADLHVDLEMELLSEIAANAYSDGQILFSEQQLIQQVTGFMRDTLNAPPALDARKIIEAIEIQQGLLVERAPDVYSFSHLTIQEYLTAEFFHRPTKLRELVENYLFDEKWREVFLLSAGMTGTDDLLLCMFDHCQKTLQQNEIASRCVRWALDISKETGDAKQDAAMRLYVLSIPLRFKRYTENRRERTEKSADDLLDAYYPNFLRGKRGPKNWSERPAQKWLNHFSKLLRIKTSLASTQKALADVAQERASLDKAPSNRYEFPRRINTIVCSSLGLDEDLHGLPRAKAKKLLNVFYGYKLIVDCKNSALRLSTSTWEEITTRMATFERIESREVPSRKTSHRK
jgi:predicted NACHT family NTPase